MDYNILGKQLKAARILADMKQSDVAKQIGTSIMTLSKWERGENRIDIGKFVDLCVIYKVDCASLLRKADDRLKTETSEFEDTAKQLQATEDIDFVTDVIRACVEMEEPTRVFFKQVIKGIIIGED